MPNYQTHNKQIAKNTIFLYFRLLLTMFISLYTTRVVLNILGVIDYGIYNVVCGFVALFSFLNTTMSNGIQRFYNFEAGKNGISAVTKVFQTAMLIQLILVAFILLIIEPLGIWYINNKMVIPPDRLFAANWVFQFSLFSLIFLVLQVPFSAAIIAHEKMDYFASVGIIDAILKLLIVVILPYLGGDSLIIYGLLVFLISIINLLLYSIYASKKFKELQFNIIFHKGLFTSIFKFTGWNLVEMFAWTTQGQGVNMVLNFFLGPTVNAAQGIASQVSSALNSFCSNLSVAFRPQLVHSYANGNYERTNTMMFAMSKAMFAMMVMIIIPLTLEMSYVLHIWLGDSIPEYTLQFTILVLFSMLPRNMTMALSQVIHASGKMKNYQLCSALIILLILPISYFLLKNNISPIYVYRINIIIFVLLWFADLLLLKKVHRFSIKLYCQQVVFPCFVILILSPIIPYITYISMDDGILRLLIIISESIFFTLILSYFLLISSDERQSINRYILNRIKNNQTKISD